MAVRCSSCADAAVVDQPYRGAHLCARHFRASVEGRFRRELARQLPQSPVGTIAVALSGGKDSAVSLALAHEALGRRPDVRLVAITVDEGIAGYRAGTVLAARSLTQRLGVPHFVVRADEELGTTTDRAAERMATTVPCSFCGVWRRGLLNRAARDAGARALLLGFNLDDLAQTVLMNLTRGDLPRLIRMAPHRTSRAGLISRLAPLGAVPEREVYLYARLRGLPFDHGECPHARRASRNLYREIVWQLEDAQPGTRQALVRTQARLVELIGDALDSGAPGRCRACGEPATGERCRACEYLAIVREPLASEAP
jgi:uncharacterized protein (TIGR00269 family)